MFVDTKSKFKIYCRYTETIVDDSNIVIDPCEITDDHVLEHTVDSYAEASTIVNEIRRYDIQPLDIIVVQSIVFGMPPTQSANIHIRM